MKRSHAPVTRIGPAWLGAGGKWGFPLPRDPLDPQGKVQFALHYDVILLFYNDNVTSLISQHKKRHYCRSHIWPIVELMMNMLGFS